jgi:sec-independent protein translocase protein TatA
MLAEIFGPDLLIVLLLVALLFGGSKLPSLARSLGSAKSEFEKGLREGGSDATKAAPPTAQEETVTLTRAELDALVAEREARARRESDGTGQRG